MTKTTKTPAPMWAAYDDMAIWGTGPTAEAAIGDVAQWVNTEDAAGLQASLKTAVMTSALQAQVERGGSAAGHDLMADGTLGTLRERDDEIAEIQ